MEKVLTRTFFGVHIVQTLPKYIWIQHWEYKIILKYNQGWLFAKSERSGMSANFGLTTG